MKNKEACFMRNTDDWKTPKILYDLFMEKGLKDPCPFQCKENNLNKDFGEVNLFINPPYSDIKSWVDYAINHIKKHPYNYALLLIPSRTDTKYFQKMLQENIDMGIFFFKGRLHFNDSKNGVPFPSCLIKLNMPAPYREKGTKYIIEKWFFKCE